MKSIPHYRKSAHFPELFLVVLGQPIKTKVIFGGHKKVAENKKTVKLGYFRRLLVAEK
jgi:hypothetical protein